MMTQLQPLAVSLHRVTKTQLADLVLKMQDNISSAIENLTKVVSLINANFKKLEAGLAVACNVNDRPRHNHLPWGNAQYSRQECLEIMGIPEAVDNNDLDKRNYEIFSEIGVGVEPDNLEACHRLKNKDGTKLKL